MESKYALKRRNRRSMLSRINTINNEDLGKALTMDNNCPSTSSNAQSIDQSQTAVTVTTKLSWAEAVVFGKQTEATADAAPPAQSIDSSDSTNDSDAQQNVEKTSENLNLNETTDSTPRSVTQESVQKSSWDVQLTQQLLHSYKLDDNEYPTVGKLLSKTAKKKYTNSGNVRQSPDNEICLGKPCSTQKHYEQKQNRGRGNNCSARTGIGTPSKQQPPPKLDKQPFKLSTASSGNFQRRHSSGAKRETISSPIDGRSSRSTVRSTKSPKKNREKFGALRAQRNSQDSHKKTSTKQAATKPSPALNLVPAPPPPPLSSSVTYAQVMQKAVLEQGLPVTTFTTTPTKSYNTESATAKAKPQKTQFAAKSTAAAKNERKTTAIKSDSANSVKSPDSLSKKTSRESPAGTYPQGEGRKRNRRNNRRRRRPRHSFNEEKEEDIPPADDKQGVKSPNSDDIFEFPPLPTSSKHDMLQMSCTENIQHASGDASFMREILENDDLKFDDAFLFEADREVEAVFESNKDDNQKKRYLDAISDVNVLDLVFESEDCFASDDKPNVLEQQSQQSLSSLYFTTSTQTTDTAPSQEELPIVDQTESIQPSADSISAGDADDMADNEMANDNIPGHSDHIEASASDSNPEELNEPDNDNENNEGSDDLVCDQDLDQSLSNDRRQRKNQCALSSTSASPATVPNMKLDTDGYDASPNYMYLPAETPVYTEQLSQSPSSPAGVIVGNFEQHKVPIFNYSPTMPITVSVSTGEMQSSSTNATPIALSPVYPTILTSATRTGHLTVQSPQPVQPVQFIVSSQPFIIQTANSPVPIYTQQSPVMFTSEATQPMMTTMTAQHTTSLSSTPTPAVIASPVYEPMTITALASPIFDGSPKTFVQLPMYDASGGTSPTLTQQPATPQPLHYNAIANNNVYNMQPVQLIPTTIYNVSPEYQPMQAVFTPALYTHQSTYSAPPPVMTNSHAMPSTIYNDNSHIRSGQNSNNTNPPHQPMPPPPPTPVMSYNNPMEQANTMMQQQQQQQPPLYGADGNPVVPVSPTINGGMTAHQLLQSPAAFYSHIAPFLDSGSNEICLSTIFRPSCTRNRRAEVDALPASIQTLFTVITTNYSDYAFVYALSAQLCQERVPMDSYVYFKMSLLLSLASFEPDDNRPPISLMVICYDTYMANYLLNTVGQLAARFVGPFDEVRPPQHINTARYQWEEANPIMLAQGGVYYAGDWKRLKSSLSEELLKDVENSTVASARTAKEYQLETAIWAHWHPEDGPETETYHKFFQVFGLPIFMEDDINEVIMNYILHQYRVQIFESSSDFLSIPLEDMRLFLNLISQRKVDMTEPAEQLLRKYFVVTRVERPNVLSKQSYVVLKQFAESFAKLSLRYEVLEMDVVAAIFLCENFLQNIYGQSKVPPPTFRTFNYIGKIDMYMTVFYKWLENYLNKSYDGDNCSEHPGAEEHAATSEADAVMTEELNMDYED